MSHDPVSFFSCQLNPDKCLTDIEITEQIIIDSIQELSSTSAAGPDDVPSSLLLKCAVFERIIRKQVVAFMNRQGHMNNTQHGFRSSRSCLSALLDVFDDLMHMLSSDTTVDMIYLDFPKAFDKVDHGVLLHKLKDLGITGKLGIWFFQFLTNRTHYVRIPGGISKDSPV